MAGTQKAAKAEDEADPFEELSLDMDASLDNNQYPKKEFDEAREAAGHVSLCAQFATQEIWDQYKDTVSSGPAKWTLAHAINAGVRCRSLFVGCHAGDSSSYDDFKDFFSPVIHAYHKGFDIENDKHITDMDAAKISITLTDATKAKIISTRVCVARNLAQFTLNPASDEDTRLAICDLMDRVYAKIDPSSDFAGVMFRHTTMSDEERERLLEAGLLFRSRKNQAMILFGDKDWGNSGQYCWRGHERQRQGEQKDQEQQSGEDQDQDQEVEEKAGHHEMQAASGCYRYWPRGRAIFHNKDKTFVNWINESDHLSIVSMEKGCDVLTVFNRLADGVKMIEEGIKEETGGESFMVHPILGSVTCCPSNIGTSMRGSVRIRTPLLIARYEGEFDEIDDMCYKHNCQAHSLPDTTVEYIEISNWRRIGFTEYDLMHDVINCANYLAEQEDQLAADAKKAVERAKELFDDGESARKEHNWEAAIDKYTAALAVEGTYNVELTADLRSALAAAKATNQAKELFDDGESARKQHNREAAIEKYTAALAVNGTDDQELTDNVNSALRSTTAWMQAKELFEAGKSAKIKYDWENSSSNKYSAALDAAIDKYTAALAVEGTNDEELTADLRSARAAAKATKQAKELFDDGESARKQQNWMAAIDKYTAALAVEGTNDEELTTDLRSALAAAKARQARDLFNDGELARDVQDWEAAIDKFTAALKFESTRAESDLWSALASAKAALASAEASMVVRDFARGEVEAILRAEQTEPGETSIKVLKHALTLSKDVNSDELMGRLETVLASKTEALAKRRHKKERCCVKWLREIGKTKRQALLAAMAPADVSVQQQAVGIESAAGENTTALLQSMFRGMGKSPYVWSYGLSLLIVPFCCMVLSDESGMLGSFGVFAFVIMLWMSGWLVLWLLAERLEPIQDKQRLHELPRGWVQKLQMVVVANECYNYCGFSFFPAVPWKAMDVPPGVPRPENAMLAGLFEFSFLSEDAPVKFWTYIAACCMVLLSAVLLGLTRGNAGSGAPTRRMKVVLVCFELMSFPLIKQLMSVFSCTSISIWLKDGQFCKQQDNTTDTQQCMDIDPTVTCWDRAHLAYCGVTMLMLTPWVHYQSITQLDTLCSIYLWSNLMPELCRCRYYVGSIYFLLAAQAKQSVVVKDGVYIIVSAQSKMLLAAISSSFGDCYPIVIVVAVQVVVLLQLLMAFAGTAYCSLQSMNVLRLSGLVLASVNGFFALIVLWTFRDDPAGGSPCFTRDAALASSESDHNQGQIVASYTTFATWVLANVATMLGMLLYRRYQQSRQAFDAALFHSPNEGAVSGQLSCNVMSVDLPGEICPYELDAILTVDEHHEKRTSIPNAGGDTPTVSFSWDLYHVAILRIRVMDTSQCIGETTIPITKSATQEWDKPQWFTLKTGSKHTGRIKLNLLWKGSAHSKCLRESTLEEWRAVLNIPGDALEVDYPIVQARMSATRSDTGERPPADFALAVNLMEKSGQQMETTTLEMLFEENDIPVSLIGLDPREPSGNRVINMLEQVHEVRSSSLCAIQLPDALRCVNSLLCRRDPMGAALDPFAPLAAVSHVPSSSTVQSFPSPCHRTESLPDSCDCGTRGPPRAAFRALRQTS